MCWAALEAGPGQFVNEENWWAPAKHSKASLCYHQRHWTSVFPTNSSISRLSWVPLPPKLLRFPPRSCCEFSTWLKRAEQWDPLPHFWGGCHETRLAASFQTWTLQEFLLVTSSSRDSLFWSASCRAGCASSSCHPTAGTGWTSIPTGMCLPLHTAELFPSPRKGNIRGGDDKEVTQGAALRSQHQHPHPAAAPGVKHPQRAWKPNQKPRKWELEEDSSSKQLKLKLRIVLRALKPLWSWAWKEPDQHCPEIFSFQSLVGFHDFSDFRKILALGLCSSLLLKVCTSEGGAELRGKTWTHSRK